MVLEIPRYWRHHRPIDSALCFWLNDMDERIPAHRGRSIDPPVLNGHVMNALEAAQHATLSASPNGRSFAEWEQPQLFTEELRASFSSLR